MKLRDFMQDRNVLDPGTYTFQLTGVEAYHPENATTSKGTPSYPSVQLKLKETDGGEAYSDFMRLHPKQLWRVAELLSILGVTGDDEVPDLNDADELASFFEQFVGSYITAQVKVDIYEGTKRNQFKFKGLADGAGV